MLKQWIPNFLPTKDLIDRVPIWVHLPGLPMEYWDSNLILSIASKASKVLCIDENYLNFDRGIYAWVCVEVDLTEPLSLGTNVAVLEEDVSFFQTFVYEKYLIYALAAVALVINSTTVILR